MRPTTHLKTFLTAAVFAASAYAQDYTIDSAHSSAQFSVRHMMVANVRGEFGNIKGTVHWDPRNLAASKVEATIDANTVVTREAKRDAHLKSPDFFDVAKYPVMTFKSTQFENRGGKLAITGDLTIHGVTKSVVLNVEGPTPEVKDPWGGLRMGTTATTKVNRKDFGLTWNQALETGGVLVGDEVSITLDLELQRNK